MSPKNLGICVHFKMTATSRYKKKGFFYSLKLRGIGQLLILSGKVVSFFLLIAKEKKRVRNLLETLFYDVFICISISTFDIPYICQQTSLRNVD